MVSAAAVGHTGLLLPAGGWLCMWVPPEEEDDAVVSCTGLGGAACPGSHCCLYGYLANRASPAQRPGLP